jgi:hypothetical protein
MADKPHCAVCNYANAPIDIEAVCEDCRRLIAEVSEEHEPATPDATGGLLEDLR